MKPIYSKWALIFTLFISGISCNKDILDKEPMDRLSESTVFSSKKAVEQYVNDRYNGLFTTGVLEWWFYEPNQLFYSPITDESVSLFPFWHTQEISNGGLTADNLGFLSNKWYNSYQEIAKNNGFFENIVLADQMTEAEVLRLTGEVKFIRAFIYTDLVKHWGGVPLITKVADLNNYESVPKSSFDDCVKFIVSELDEIIQKKMLADSYNSLALTDKGRVTLAAVHAMKSDILLFAASELSNPSRDVGKWTAAATASKTAIDFAVAQGHGLYEDYQRIFLDRYNKEIILDRAVNSDKGGPDNNIDVFLAPNGYDGWGSIFPTQQMVDAYETKDGKAITDPGSGYTFTKFWENRDPRFYATIFYDGAMWKERPVELFDAVPGVTPGKDSKGGSGGWNASTTGFNWKKYLTPELLPSQLWDGKTSQQNPVIYRFAELLLNYAETQIELGNYVEAATYINMVRSRPGVQMPPVTETGAALTTRYRNERRIEFALENRRYFDIRRWKIAKGLVNNIQTKGIQIIKQADGSKVYNSINGPTNLFPDKYYWVPIPLNEISKSGGALTQNPGY